MTKFAQLTALWIAALPAASPAAEMAPRPTASRADWYRESIVSLHFDNHSGLLAKGIPGDELGAMLAGVPVTMLQVSAQSNAYATYPTKVGLNNPAAAGYDTLAVFSDLARRQGKRLCIYMSVDRRPLELKQHPEWAAVGATGLPENVGEPIVCQRPNRDRAGYLYERFLPQIDEIIRRYDPAGLWFDGDYIFTRPCWCSRCLKEWKADTGLEPPRKADDPQWARWTGWHQVRYRAYQRVVGEAIHRASPKALYTSNWSWAWTPEPALELADTLSGDAWNVQQVHAVTQRWGAQEKPFDIMSYCTPNGRSLATPGAKHRYSLQRTFQEGALAMASGGVWFVWSFNGTQVPAYGVDVARQCAQYARDRQPALGPSTSLSQVAVLDSETSWQPGGQSGPTSLVHRIARSLAEAHYLTDIVNEQTFRETHARYRIVIVPEHQNLARATLQALQALVQQGGMVLFTGGALHGPGDERGEVAALLGLSRSSPKDDRPARLVIGKGRWHLVDVWGVEPGTARVVARTVDGRPILCSRSLGKGTIAYLASSSLRYPDDGLAAHILRVLGHGPSYEVSGGARDAAVLCTLRQTPGQVVLHVIDMSARCGAGLADVDTPEYTDFNPPLDQLTITLPFPSAPTAFRAVPPGTRAKADYQGGRLKVQIETLQNHAAVILDMPATTPLGLLPPETGGAGLAFHPENNRPGRVFSDDFEATRAGHPPAAGWVAENRGQTAIVVTDEAPAGGRHCLKFVDTPDSSFWPYLHRSLSPMHRGTARFSFDLRFQPGVPCMIEARNEGKGAGPSLRIDEIGKLHASGKPLLTLPPDAWHHLAVEFTLDGDSPAYQLTIQSPGTPPQTFKGLPYGSPWFFMCNSIYFVGSGQKAGCFFLDNVVFERLP